MTPTSAGAAQAPSPHDPYIRLVPESVGAWKRTMLRGARGDPDREPAPGAEAEFTRGDVRAAVRVSSPGTAPGTPPAAPVERTTDQGSERIAAEAGGVVRETVRRADGRVEVVLSRGDGVVVSVQAFRTTPAELRAIALGILPLAR